MVRKFLIKSLLVCTGINSNSDSENQQLAQEMQKPVIRKFEKHKVYSCFKGDILGADLADMQLISKYNNGSRFLLRELFLWKIKKVLILPMRYINF